MRTVEYICDVCFQKSSEMIGLPPRFFSYRSFDKSLDISLSVEEYSKHICGDCIRQIHKFEEKENAKAID